MPSLNQITLCGHLTREVEVKYLQSGTAVCEFGLAVNDRIKRGDEWVDDPLFVQVTVFGKQAEYLGENGANGAAVLVTGKLKLDQWEQDGQKRQKHKVLVDRVQLLGKRDSAPHSQERQERPQEHSQAPEQDTVPF